MSVLPLVALWSIASATRPLLIGTRSGGCLLLALCARRSVALLALRSRIAHSGLARSGLGAGPYRRCLLAARLTLSALLLLTFYTLALSTLRPVRLLATRLRFAHRRL